jgi:hypothetical protein
LQAVSDGSVYLDDPLKIRLTVKIYRLSFRLETRRTMMTASRYRPITRDAFASAMSGVGFAETVRPGGEHAYARRINNGPNPGRFEVLIYSSVQRDTGVTRPVGGDAIRILLMDAERNRPVLDWRVYRTASALDNTTERARSAWRYAMDPAHHCPDCKAMLVERTGKRGSFLGCTAFPACKATRPLPEPQKLAA